jgi:hypothetical protein
MTLNKNLLPLLSVTCLLTASTVKAAPYYVGENPTPENSIYLGFRDAPTEKRGALEEGNIAALDLNALVNFSQTTAVAANLPFYNATRNATGTKSETNFGNIAAGLNWSNSMSRTTDRFRWGYMATANVYAPTSRNEESHIVATVNPTVDYFRYETSATSLTPQAGVYMSQNRWSAKTNVGYGFTRIDKDSIAQGDPNRHSYIWQTGASFHPTNYLNLSAEYNTIYLDKTSSAGRGQYRHAVSPSVSGKKGNIVGNVFVSVPLDASTRDLSPLALGLNGGLSF